MNQKPKPQSVRQKYLKTHDGAALPNPDNSAIASTQYLLNSEPTPPSEHLFLSMNPFTEKKENSSQQRTFKITENELESTLNKKTPENTHPLLLKLQNINQNFSDLEIVSVYLRNIKDYSTHLTLLSFSNFKLNVLAKALGIAQNTLAYKILLGLTNQISFEEITKIAQILLEIKPILNTPLKNNENEFLRFNGAVSPAIYTLLLKVLSPKDIAQFAGIRLNDFLRYTKNTPYNILLSLNLSLDLPAEEFITKTLNLLDMQPANKRIATFWKLEVYKKIQLIFAYKDNLIFQKLNLTNPFIKNHQALIQKADMLRQGANQALENLKKSELIQTFKDKKIKAILNDLKTFSQYEWLKLAPVKQLAEILQCTEKSILKANLPINLYAFENNSTIPDLMNAVIKELLENSKSKNQRISNFFPLGENFYLLFYSVYRSDKKMADVLQVTAKGLKMARRRYFENTVEKEVPNQNQDIRAQDRIAADALNTENLPLNTQSSPSIPTLSTDQRASEVVQTDQDMTNNPETFNWANSPNLLFYSPSPEEKDYLDNFNKDFFRDKNLF